MTPPPTRLAMPMPAEDTSALDRLRPVILSLVLVGVVFALYRPGLSGPFIGDDVPNIIEIGRAHV